MSRQALSLPDFPWDALVPYAERAKSHPDGYVDLSVGSPVDPTPDLIRDALNAATDAHAYPATAGSPALREAIVEWFARRRGVDDLSVANVIPTIGSKELIALLPLILGVRAGDTVVHPGWRIPPTRSARPWSARRRSRAMTRPSGQRRPRSSGSTRRATPTARCSRSSSCGRPSRVRASSTRWS